MTPLQEYLLISRKASELVSITSHLNEDTDAAAVAYIQAKNAVRDTALAAHRHDRP